MKFEFVCSSVLASFLVLGFFQESVHGRPLLMSQARPRPDNAAASRWLVSQSSWGVLNTISSDWGGAPFGFFISFFWRPTQDNDLLMYEKCESLQECGFIQRWLTGQGKGIPYFYLTALDPTASNALKDQRSSFTISEYNLGTCGKKDPENPSCAKITLVGKLKLLEGTSKEAEFAQTALFTKHPEMKGKRTSPETDFVIL
ncbi:UNVERIFIED_CONTAM: hypothetical protein Sradi_4245700 [Sesamum radiatum]|uniref:CREG-like beta-barrel domain-containing protein n=1 Tax=Sesamum radiatum TaxID=300843 RepID=A0AAW2P709_SESRA